MAKIKSMLARILYGGVGVGGVLSVLGMVGVEPLTNPLAMQILGILGVVGSVSWGVVALTGDRNEDLLAMIPGLK